MSYDPRELTLLLDLSLFQSRQASMRVRIAARDLFLEPKQSMQHPFGGRGAARDINIHRNHRVDPLQDTINIEDPTRRSASSKRHHILGFAHLIVNCLEH